MGLAVSDETLASPSFAPRRAAAAAGGFGRRLHGVISRRTRRSSGLRAPCLSLPSLARLASGRPRSCRWEGQLWPWARAAPSRSISLSLSANDVRTVAVRIGSAGRSGPPSHISLAYAWQVLTRLLSDNPEPAGAGEAFRLRASLASCARHACTLHDRMAIPYIRIVRALNSLSALPGFGSQACAATTSRARYPQRSNLCPRRAVRPPRS
ncbi:hypothetical protein C8Q79DRAFT_191189 [Trametes meyenii]|nr:hypothetical protein C8Q79DRAFT_191189 [Trametes meyenii]